MQGVSIDQYSRESFSGPQTFSPFAEGGSRVPGSIEYASPRSDDSEFEPTSRTYAPSHVSFSSCRSFISKPIYPFSFADYTFEGEEAYSSFAKTTSISSSHSSIKSGQAHTELQTPKLLDLGGRQTAERRTSASSLDLADMTETLLEHGIFGLQRNNVFEGSTCGLCLRLLSQISPWGSHPMVWGGDMSVASVLSCWHVYHAECLEQTTPKTQNHDPTCPLCEKSEGRGQDKWAVSRLKIGLPRLRSLADEGSSRVWSCGQSGDCAEGAIHLLKQNNVVSLRNQSRLRRQMSLKGNSNIDQVGNSKRSGLCSPWVSHEAVGHSNVSPGVSFR